VLASRELLLELPPEAREVARGREYMARSMFPQMRTSWLQAITQRKHMGPSGRVRLSTLADVRTQCTVCSSSRSALPMRGRRSQIAHSLTQRRVHSRFKPFCRMETFRRAGLQTSALYAELENQGFAGNPLDRSVLSGRSGGVVVPASAETDKTSSFIIVCGSKVFGEKTATAFTLAWFPAEQISAHKEASFMAATSHLLGGTDQGMCFALSMNMPTESAETEVRKLNAEAVAVDVRMLLNMVTHAEAAIAGQAVALTRWHAVRQRMCRPLRQACTTPG
jgi:hypothetical protein